MDKDEVLELSRKDNKKMDERENEIILHANQIAFAVGTLICVVFTVLEAVFSDAFNPVPWAIYFSMTGSESAVKYYKLHKNSDLAISIIEIICAALMVSYYIVKLVKRI